MFGSAPNSQKSTPNSLSPVTRATSEDEERSSLFSNSDQEEKQDFDQETPSFKCSKTLKFLIEAEDEMSSIWKSKTKVKTCAPRVLVQNTISFQQPSEKSYNSEIARPVPRVSNPVPQRCSLNFEKQSFMPIELPKRPSNPSPMQNCVNGNY